MVFEYCIIGFGIAGQLVLLELLRANILPKSICILDSNFIGGALATEYGCVISNTPWQKTRTALEHYIEYSKPSIQELDTKYLPSQCQPVQEIANACCATARAAIRLHAIDMFTTTVLSVEQGTPHTIQHIFGTLQAKHIFATHGATEKRLDISMPCLPLSIALDAQQLQKHVRKLEDRVVVFGTAHSGTILIKHLHDLNIQTTAVYNTPTPFLFARDDEYDGIKEAAADYADSILRGEYTNLTLVSWSDQLQVFKALQKATKVIYSVGFTAKQIPGIPIAYDPATAKLKDAERMYGFGIAYPGTTIYKDRTYTDVSVLSFQQQIQRCLPKILEQQ
jgi:hypothetical protein